MMWRLAAIGTALAGAAAMFRRLVELVDQAHDTEGETE